MRHHPSFQRPVNVRTVMESGMDNIMGSAYTPFEHRVLFIYLFLGIYADLQSLFNIPPRKQPTVQCVNLETWEIATGV